MDSGEVVEGTNVYGLVRASPGADGKVGFTFYDKWGSFLIYWLQESVVLVAHYRNIGNAPKAPASGLGIGLSLLRYLKDVPWLSKDIVLLLADGKCKKCLWTWGPF